MSETFPVFFHIGQELTLKTIAKKGRIAVSDSSIRLMSDGGEITFRGDQLTSVALIRPHAVGSVIKIGVGSDYLFVAVTRFMIGQFALINYFATVRLFKAIAEASPTSSTNELTPRRRHPFVVFVLSALAAFAVVGLLSVLKSR